MPIPRYKSRLREKNHIKTMYCWYCCKIRDFIENYDANEERKNVGSNEDTLLPGKTER